MSIAELQQNPLVQRVIDIFDADGNGEVDFKEFIQGVSQFSVKGDKLSKLRFAFRIYDMDNDEYISNGELFQVKYTVYLIYIYMYISIHVYLVSSIEKNDLSPTSVGRLLTGEKWQFIAVIRIRRPFISHSNSSICYQYSFQLMCYCRPHEYIIPALSVILHSVTSLSCHRKKMSWVFSIFVVVVCWSHEKIRPDRNIRVDPFLLAI